MTSILKGFALACLLTILLPFRTPAGQPGPRMTFSETGYTNYGEWAAWGFIQPSSWDPGRPLSIMAILQVKNEHLARLASEAHVTADGFCLLVTAERTFDADGHFRQANDEKMSTLLTPTGLAIEGGIQGACTNRFDYDFRTPVDQFATLSFENCETTVDAKRAHFAISTTLPQDLPPGIYRLRLDFGVTSRTRFYSLNCDAFATRPFFQGRAPESHLYSAPIPANGIHVSGRSVIAASITPRPPWIILSDYNSNGYRGVVSDEDQPYFALSNRNLIPDDVILPMYDDSGNRVSYSLEPQFPADAIEARSNLPWNYASGHLSIEITDPAGQTVSLGDYPFAAKKNNGATTNQTAFTRWQPQTYGKYTAKLTGWIADQWGRAYTGGGTYHFWIAKRLTLATATFQGVSYPVGGRYGRDLAFAPAVPADVEVSAVLYSNSDPGAAISVSYGGKASPSGVFGSAQGAQPLPLNYPGEYSAHILARYADAQGHLWVCSMRHAGVVYPADSPVLARGKKLKIQSQYVDRGETHLEGYTVPGTDISFLQHINFPFQSGDVILIASEQQSANKIEPVLIFEDKINPLPYDTRLATLGATNLKIRTSNGYSPHLFPEYISDWMYYYGAAPRPGFMSRFLVGENGVRAPYWPTSPNSFGGQIGTSNNGDLPGDIYRLIGGIVIRENGGTPKYAGYMSSAFLLPRGTNNNRIIAPGSEDVIGSTGERARFFLVGLRPGMVYETGASFAPALQIDPILPVVIRFTLWFPDGRSAFWEGTSDAFGTFAGSTRSTLDQAGVYTYQIEGQWQGFRGVMPGLPSGGGEFYVIEKDRPANSAAISLNLPGQSTFNAAQGLTIRGTTTASVVYYAAVIPGAVIDQGRLTPTSGAFEYRFDPVAISQRIPTYDIINLVNGRPEIGKVVHLTFFARETPAGGSPIHSFVRVIFRGTKVLYTK
jgi:hypothetical protein